MSNIPKEGVTDVKELELNKMDSWKHRLLEICKHEDKGNNGEVEAENCVEKQQRSQGSGHS